MNKKTKRTELKTKTNRKELHESLRAAVGLRPRKPGTTHDPVMGRIIHTAVNTSANRHAGEPDLGEVAELIRLRIEQLELVLDVLEGNGEAAITEGKA